MTPEILKEIDRLYQLVKEAAPENAVAVSVFMNSEGVEMEVRTRSPESLKRSGVAMRNLSGDWVK
jgi:hypothetical protein